MTTNYCPTARNFYRLRTALLQVLPLSRHDIRPSSRLDDLIPLNKRRVVWTRLRSNGLSPPQLVLSPLMDKLALVSTLPATIATALWFQSCWALFFIVPWVWIALWVTRPWAKYINPAGPMAVADFVIYMTRFHHSPTYRWSRREIEVKTRLIISESLGVSFSKLKLDTKFLELGAD